MKQWQLYSWDILANCTAFDNGQEVTWLFWLWQLGELQCRLFKSHHCEGYFFQHLFLHFWAVTFVLFPAGCGEVYSKAFSSSHCTFGLTMKVVLLESYFQELCFSSSTGSKTRFEVEILTTMWYQGKGHLIMFIGTNIRKLNWNKSSIMQDPALESSDVGRWGMIWCFVTKQSMHC